ncbi:unnamed protein product [Ambrosiozyma monospora]|uniref:Unnamed protein product n=1 Tax=Ambrosiozyma monospora TaxID=43982 RepID=A0ACB5SX42_AMBMO|nr:unnamed protein product [Ambrosiozyma monospora]
MKRGPKRKNLPTIHPGVAIITNCSPSLLEGERNARVVSRDESLMSKGNNITLYDLVPVKTVYTMIDTFIDKSNVLETLGLTKKYLHCLLKNSQFFVVAGVLCLVCFIHPEYKEYLQNLYKYVHFQRIILRTDIKDKLEFLIGYFIESELAFRNLEFLNAESYLKDVASTVQVFNFHLMDDIHCETHSAKEKLVSVLLGKNVDKESIDMSLNEILCLIRNVYWTIVMTERYAGLGAGVVSQLRIETHNVGLPDSGLTISEPCSSLFDLNTDVFSLPIEYRQLSIFELKIILLNRVEESSVWFKKMDFVSKNNAVPALRNDIISKSMNYEAELDKYFECVTLLLDPSVLQSTEFVLQIKSLYIVAKCLIAEGVVQLLASIPEKTSFDQHIISSKTEHLLSDVLHLKEYFTVDITLKETFHIFIVYELLKLLACHSATVVGEEDAQLVDFTSQLVSIINKLAYEGENVFAKKALDEYNSTLQTKVLDSFFFYEGLSKLATNKFTLFDGFMYETNEDIF